MRLYVAGHRGMVGSALVREAESRGVDLLIGDATKAREKLGWEPKARVKDLVRIMADADRKLAERERKIRQATGEH